MANIFLKSQNIGVWQYDSANSSYYLEIGGVRVAQIDSTGFFKIKGDIWTNESL